MKKIDLGVGDIVEYKASAMREEISYGIVEEVFFSLSYGDKIKASVAPIALNSEGEGDLPVLVEDSRITKVYKQYKPQEAGEKKDGKNRRNKGGKSRR